jgi:hypothetical protein
MIMQPPLAEPAAQGTYSRYTRGGPHGATNTEGPYGNPAYREAKSRMENLSLASGRVTQSAKITVELVADDVPMVVITFPTEPIRISPRRYDEIAARCMRILANASTELAARRRPGRRPKLDL